MSWLTIGTGLLLAAIVIPPLILLYFLKLRRRTQPIACTLLWSRSVEDLRANAPFQRLRRNLLLLLQLLALLLLAMAVAQPQVEAAGSAGGKTVMLIDNSASMTATDVADAESRLEAAKALARDRIEARYGRGLFSQSAGETMIIAFSSRAEVVSPFTDSRTQLLSAIGRIEPTHGRTRIGEALDLARAYTTNVNPDSDRPVGEPATLELFSDGRIADLEEQVLRGETLFYYPVGLPEPDNVAVTAISIERPYDRPTAVEVFASLANFNREAVTADVQLSVNDVAQAIEEIGLDAAAPDAATGELVPHRRNVVFTPFEQPRGAVIEVANLRGDDVEADNAARLVVPPPRRLSVALVDSDSFLLQMLLEGMGLASLELLSAERFEQLATEGGTDAYDVVVLDDHAPPVDELPLGRYLTFGALPPLEGLEEVGPGGAQLILDTRDDHPVFRFVNLDQLYISRFELVQPDDDVQILAEGSGGPAIVAVSRGAMQAICVTFDPLDSNWPFQRGFVTFVVNAVEYLGRSGEALTSGSFAPGEALTTRLPLSATDIELLPPGRENPVPVPASNPALFSWGPIRTSGVYALSWDEPGADDRQTRLFAVNAVSEAEGDIRPAENVLAREENVRIAGAGGGRYLPLWPWAIGLCLLVLMLEWWVYHRKAYI